MRCKCPIIAQFDKNARDLPIEHSLQRALFGYELFSVMAIIFKDHFLRDRMSQMGRYFILFAIRCPLSTVNVSLSFFLSITKSNQLT